MKKTTVLAVLCILCTVMLFGADTADDSVAYRNIKIYKVYTHPDAYVIMFYTSSIDLGQVTVPTEWFKSGSGKGILNTYRKSVTPYMTLQYKDGVFSKIVLNMPADMNGLAWEHLNQSADIGAAKKKDTLTLE